MLPLLENAISSSIPLYLSLVSVQGAPHSFTFSHFVYQLTGSSSEPTPCELNWVSSALSLGP
ncbi:MAG: hypothetical protein ACXWWC_02800 [Chitinophagaceae bacterium]